MKPWGRRALASMLVALVLLAAPSAEAAALYLVWDADVADCQAKVTRLFLCMLPLPDFDALVAEYSGGTPLTFEHASVIHPLCSRDNFQCVVDEAGISPHDGDMVVHYYGGAGAGAFNDTRAIQSGDRSISIRVAWIFGGDGCDLQTCNGSHEVYEGITDADSADCCNGQTPPYCLNCDPSCASIVQRCYPLRCGGETFSVQYLGRASLEFQPSRCTALADSGPSGGSLHNPCGATADCTDGLTCAPWSESGGEPFANACCRGVGGTCHADGDCCGATRCDDATSTCGCIGEGHYCAGDADCCESARCDTAQRLCATKAAASVGAGCALAPDADSGAPMWTMAAIVSIAIASKRRRPPRRRGPRT